MSDQPQPYSAAQAAPIPEKPVISEHTWNDLKLFTLIVIFMLVIFMVFSVLIVNRYEESRAIILAQSGQVEMSQIR